MNIMQVNNTPMVWSTEQKTRSIEHQKMSRALKEHAVIPDVIDDTPTNIVKIKYGDLQVSNGNKIAPTQVFETPTEICWPTESNTFYTLCMTDPDAPSRKDPTFGEFLHWLVVNVPGCDVHKGEDMAQYVGSGPPKDTGLHRYIFLAYQQPGRLTCDEPRIPNNTADNRKSFSIRKFASKYNLKLVAANFYQAEYDETTPKVYRQLGLAA